MDPPTVKHTISRRIKQKRARNPQTIKSVAVNHQVCRPIRACPASAPVPRAPGVQSATRHADVHPLCDIGPCSTWTVPVHGTLAGACSSACLRRSSHDTMRSATGIESKRSEAPPATGGRTLRVPSAGVDGGGDSVLREDRHVRGRVSTTIGTQEAPPRAAKHPRVELVPARAPARAGRERDRRKNPCLVLSPGRHLVPRTPAGAGASSGRSEEGGESTGASGRVSPRLYCYNCDQLGPQGWRASPRLTRSTGDQLIRRETRRPPPARASHAHNSSPRGSPVAVATAGTRLRRTCPRSRRTRCKAKVYLSKVKAYKLQGQGVFVQDQSSPGQEKDHTVDGHHAVVPCRRRMRLPETATAGSGPRFRQLGNNGRWCDPGRDLAGVAVLRSRRRGDPGAGLARRVAIGWCCPRL